MTHGEHGKAAKTEHTPEPWRVAIGDDYYIEANGIPAKYPHHFKGDDLGKHVAIVGNRTSDFGEANARRIVACVNACAGMTNEQIDNVCMISGSLLNRFGEQMAYLGQVEKQRDDLLAALKWIDVFGFDAPELRARARMAIASVKEVS